MSSIVHLSDLHFGAETPELAPALVRAVNSLAPSLVVVSGDLTQRARTAQFAAARGFLDALTPPRLVVPGNHDVPLYDVARRFLAPLTQYRRHISAEINPVHGDDELLVVGLNTARSATWKEGRISHAQICWMEEHLASAGTRYKVVVTHHPFMPPADDVGISLVGRAVHAIEVLDRHKVDVLLAGHLHRGYAADVRQKYPGARRAILSVQAGTAISHRLRNQEANSFNVLRFSPVEIEVEVRAWDGRQYVPIQSHRYART